MQSGVVSILTPQREPPLERLLTPLMLHLFFPLTRVQWDLELSSTHIQGSSALHHRTRVSSPQQRPEASSSLVFRLGSMLSINT